MPKNPPFIHTKGNKKEIEKLMRRAKSLMVGTRNVAEQSGVPVFQRYTEIDGDIGAYILTKTVGETDIIEIVYPYTENPLPEVIPSPENIEVIPYGFYSGLTDFNIMESRLNEAGDPENWMVNFNPTVECRKAFPSDFASGLAHQDVTRLAIPPHPDLIYEGEGPDNEDARDTVQANLIKPCQYSGPMAEIVSITSGLGTMSLTGPERIALLGPEAHQWWISHVQAFGFSVQYDFRFDRMHEAAKDLDGNWWLLELSVTNGIIARRLPMLKIDAFNVKEEEAKAFVSRFKGIPSGEAFPNNRTEILQGISDGWIKEIMSPEDYDDEFLYKQIPYCSLNNWCFDEESTEARVTTAEYVDWQHPTYPTSTNHWLKNTYWKLKLIPYHVAGTPFRVEIEVIDESLLAGSSINDTQASVYYMQVAFYEPQWWAYHSWSLPRWDATFYKIPLQMEAVVWVGRVNGLWEEIFYKAKKFAREEASAGSLKKFGITQRADFRYSLADAVDKYAKVASGPVYTWSLQHNWSTSYNWKAEDIFEAGQFIYLESWTRVVVEDLPISNEPQGGDTDTWFQFWPSSYWMTRWNALEVDYVDSSSVNPSIPKLETWFYVCPHNRNAYLVRSFRWNYLIQPGTFDREWVWIANKWAFKWGMWSCPPSAQWGNAWVSPESYLPALDPDSIIKDITDYMPSLKWYHPYYPNNASPIHTGLKKNSTDWTNTPGFVATSNARAYTEPPAPPPDWIPPGPITKRCLHDSTPNWPDPSFEDGMMYSREGWLLEHYGEYTFYYSAETDMGLSDHNYDVLFPSWGNKWAGLGNIWSGDGPYNEEFSPGGTYEQPNEGCYLRLAGLDDEGHLESSHPGEESLELEIVELAIVGHKVPGGKQIIYNHEIPIVPDQSFKEGYYWRNCPVYIQTPILGTDAVIFSDQTTTTAADTTVMLSNGILPTMPTLSEETLWYRCTFIGINGPSSP